MTESIYPPCEVCGEPATNSRTEMIELEPKDGWRQVARGARHWYCDLHTPPVSPEEQAEHDLQLAALQAMAPDTVNV